LSEIKNNDNPLKKNKIISFLQTVLAKPLITVATVGSKAMAIGSPQPVLKLGFNTEIV
jgi:hypothetical protein